MRNKLYMGIAAATLSLGLGALTACNFGLPKPDPDPTPTEKLEYDMSGVSFEDVSYPYDGTQKAIAVTGTLPDGVTVRYENNTLTDVGSITATAIFTGDEQNYKPIPELHATLTITEIDYYETQTDGMTFRVQGEGAGLVSYEGSDEELTVPSEVTIGLTEYSVLRLGTGALKNGAFTRVNLPSTLTEICDEAFSGCRSLTSIRVPDGVVRIGVNAFAGCSALKTVTVGRGIEEVVSSAFEGCSEIERVEYTGSLADWCAIPDPSELTGCGKQSRALVVGGEEIVGQFNIPATVPAVGVRAFYNTPVTSVTVASGVKLGYGVFSACPDLVEATVEGDGKETASGIFRGCEKLKRVSLGSGVVKLGANAFQECSALQEVTIASGLKSIGAYAFARCTSLTAVSLPDGVEEMGSSVFRWCSALTSLRLPDSLKAVDSEFTFSCDKLQYTRYEGANYLGNENNPYVALVKAVDTALTQCRIHEDTKLVCNEAFRDCALLEKVSVPDGVVYLGYRAFSRCTSITEVELGAGIKTLGYSIFDGCNLIEKVSYGGTLRDWCSFENLVGVMHSGTQNKRLWVHGTELIGKVEIPAGVTKVGNGAFYGCSGITAVVLPDGVEAVGDDAFLQCYDLAFIRIGSGVTAIGDRAFYGCPALKEIVIGANVKKVGEYAFKECSALEKVYYGGTQSGWEKITLRDGNEALTGAVRYDYSHDEPPLTASGTGYDGNYWHYNDGEVEIWTKE